MANIISGVCRRIIGMLHFHLVSTAAINALTRMKAISSMTIMPTATHSTLHFVYLIICICICNRNVGFFFTLCGVAYDTVVPVRIIGCRNKFYVMFLYQRSIFQTASSAHAGIFANGVMLMLRHISIRRQRAGHHQCQRQCCQCSDCYYFFHCQMKPPHFLRTCVFIQIITLFSEIRKCEYAIAENFLSSYVER